MPDNAREICVNWIFKVASIRELLPRLYVEACIIPCYKFIDSGDCNAPLIRLINMTRGVGNPLVAIYARSYLCMVKILLYDHRFVCYVFCFKIGVKFTPKFKGHLKTSFYDFVTTYKQVGYI